MKDNPSFNKNSLTSVGKRLIALRSLCGLQRKQFSDKHGISYHTLRSIELDIMSISSKSMDKLIKAFRSEGLIISNENWILHGTGLMPTHGIDTSLINEEEAKYEEHSKTIQEESNLFLSLQKGRTLLTIEDECNAPYYNFGDIVGGLIISQKEGFINHINKLCIIKHPKIKNKFIMRKIIPDDKQDHFKLLALGDLDQSDSIFTGVKIDFCAPVIWYRKIS